MDAWVLWLIAAVVLAAAEVANLSFFLFPFAIGAAAAALVSLLGAATPIAVVVFAVLTARELRRSCGRSRAATSSTPPQIRTGTAALVGRDRDRPRADRQRRGRRLRAPRRRGLDRAQLRRGPDLRAGDPGTRHGDQGRDRARDG